MTNASSSKRNLQEVYQKAYAALNEAQRSAVDSIDGPVMVLAGPGTGKTQILAMRIGNILSRTDTKSSNILCLTYTDAGAISMRRRLQRFIGTEAYKVHVHTFHSFCNQVIQDHQEYFSDYTTLQHISDLEKAQMLRSLIDGFDFGHPLKRLKGNLYYEAKRMDRLFSTMKRESWTPEYLIKHIDAEMIRIENDPANFYKSTRKDYKAGDPKPRYRSKKKKMDQLRAAVEAFPVFQEMMHRAGRYDFDDMIHWVLKAFKESEDLLATYQEKFQYILVDEYQDTNGAQNQIIQLLVDYWDQPNLFVVGDDDQAIFRFQGANMSNLIELYERYSPQTIILTDNYRSTQAILDASGKLIDFNTERIENEVEGVSKILKAQKTFNRGGAPVIHEYLNVAQEEAAILEKITALQEEGVDLKEIAVIYRKHVQATNLIKALSQLGIPVDVKQRTNILYEPLVQNLELILTYLRNELEKPGRDESLLFEMMHYRFFDLPPVDVARVSMHCWKRGSQRISLRQAINDRELLTSLNLNDVDAFLQFGELLDGLISQVPHVTLQVLFERILKQGNVFREIMNSEQRTYLMQVLATFFNYLKAECHRNPDMNLSDFLENLHQMREIGLSLGMQSIMRSKDGVNFMTAHGAKGLEFEYVFMIGCNKNHWRTQQIYRDEFTLPSSIIDYSKEGDIQDERRLFYVAMTRARHTLTMSYAAENLNGMPSEATPFIAEVMTSSDISPIQLEVPESDTISLYEKLLSPDDQKLPLIDSDLIDRALERFAMTATSLNKFLTCSRSFYFEDILRVPLASSPYLGFGNAVHGALDQLIQGYQRGLDLSREKLMRLFEELMMYFQSFFTPIEYINYLEHGKAVLGEYFDARVSEWKSAKALITEKNIDHALHRDVPLRGRLDLILKQQDGRNIVIDFKTGNVDRNARNKKLKRPEKFDDPRGDYWRQMVFYKILLEAQGDASMQMDVGRMSFVEADRSGKLNDEDFLIGAGEYQLVSDEIVEVYTRMKAHDFDVDCGRYDCHWCNFVKNDFVLPEDTFAAHEEKDELINTDSLQMQFDFDI